MTVAQTSTNAESLMVLIIYIFSCKYHTHSGPNSSTTRITQRLTSDKWTLTVVPVACRAPATRQADSSTTICGSKPRSSLRIKFARHLPVQQREVPSLAAGHPPVLEVCRASEIRYSHMSPSGRGRQSSALLGHATPSSSAAKPAPAGFKV